MNSIRIFRCLLSLLVVSLALPLSRAADQEKPSERADQHLGTWKLVEFKYGEAAEFTKVSDTTQRLKLITKTHFTWVEVDQASKKVLTSAGGVYTLKGGTYTETIDFAGEGMQTYLGNAQKFTIKVEGDKLHQSGALSDGLKIEEIWERVQ